jgi:hypothetical protein
MGARISCGSTLPHDSGSYGDGPPSRLGITIATMPKVIPDSGWRILALSIRLPIELAMPVSDPSDTLATIEQLRTEVVVLTNRQAKALKDAVYVGMTPDEAREYDERRKQITRLVNQISILEQAL